MFCLHLAAIIAGAALIVVVAMEVRAQACVKRRYKEPSDPIDDTDPEHPEE